MNTHQNYNALLPHVFLSLLFLLFMVACDCPDPLAVDRSTPEPPPSERCGLTVTTFYAPRRNAPVAIIYDTRNSDSAPQGALWGAPHASTIQGTQWNALDIGQVFGIAIDSNDNVYLASSDIYVETGGNTSLGIVSGNTSRPNPPTRIFKFSPPSFSLVATVDLPSSITPLNGTGNIAYDKSNNQLFATNIEDGKIYRLSTNLNILDAYDPFVLDDGTAGIAPADEQLWAVGVNYEAIGTKVYFSRISGSARSIYSITLDALGQFPTAGSEVEEIDNIPGSAPILSDIAFSTNGENMLVAEHGDPTSAGVIRYALTSGTWTQDPMIFIGGSNNNSLPQSGGLNTGGGIDFGQVGSNTTPNSRCDQLIWASGNYLSTRSDTTAFIGLQGILTSGNQASTSGIGTSNIDTDIFIDYDNAINPPETFGAPGDVELFDCGQCGGSTLSDYLGG